MHRNPFPVLFANTAASPRFHGNGFVQLELAPNTRLHIWSPKLPPIPGHTATIHDHVWDMYSQVLLGTLIHRHWELTGDAKGCKPVDVYSVGVEGKPGVGQHIGPDFAAKTGVYEMAAGSSYNFYSQNFHETVVSPHEWVVTIMRKGSPYVPGARPRIVCARGAVPTDAFDKQHAPTEQRMWDVIAEALTMLSASALTMVWDARGG